MPAGCEADKSAAPYTFKASPWSSHSMVLGLLPAQGLGRRVLDLGCSAGYLDSILVERDYRIAGIDLPGSDWTRFPEGAAHFEADLDNGLPPLNGRFDFIVCADVLEHLKRPEHLLHQLHEVLSAGGLLIASLPNSGHLYFRLMILAGRFPRHDRGLFDRTHLRFYMRQGWYELFESAGFRIVHERTTGTPLELGLPNWFPRTIVRLLDPIAYALARLWRTMFAYQFVLSARPVSEGGA